MRVGDSSGDNLGAILLASARSHRDAPALWCKGNVLTYAELYAYAGAIAAAINVRSPVGCHDRIAIFSDRSPTAYAAILATLLAGGGYVPLNPRFPLLRNREILAESGATILICDERHRDELDELVEGISALTLIILPESKEHAEHVVVAQLVKSDLTHANLDTHYAAEQRPGALAYLFFTSGSMGKPKGVPISHTNVIAYLTGIRSFCQFGPSDRVLQSVDLTFDLSVHDMFLTWLSGACLYSVPENLARLSTRIIQEFEITACLLVPSTAAWLKQAGELGANALPSLRYSFFCGEALPGSLAEAWAGAAPNSELYNIYGPTEATVAFSWFKYNAGQAIPPAVVPLGHPLPDQAMGLFTDGKRAVDRGEICLSGTQVTEGYWRAPDLTAERFFEAEGRGWYRTGDLGRFDHLQGYLYSGRADHQVKIRGYRVELQEIEHVVRGIAGSDLVGVLPWAPDEGGVTEGCVAFTLRTSVPEAAIIAECKRRLPEYMVPMRVFAIDEIPVNVNGKVDYAALSRDPSMAEVGQ